MAEKLIGQNYTTPDLVAKVTGRAKYSEDFRAEGMLFTKLLLSPMPHARVVSLDLSAALAMPGVKAILTADDLPGAQEGQLLGEGVVSTAQGERPLTNEPVYEGEPILAVAAVDELTAANAIEAIQIEFEPLPFAVEPVASLRPGSPNARLQGNTWMAPRPDPAAGRGGAAARGAAGAAAGAGAQAPSPAAGAQAPPAGQPPPANANQGTAAAPAPGTAAGAAPAAGAPAGGDAAAGARRGGGGGRGRGGRGRGEGQAPAGDGQAAAGGRQGGEGRGRGGRGRRGGAQGDGAAPGAGARAGAGGAAAGAAAGATAADAAAQPGRGAEGRGGAAPEGRGAEGRGAEGRGRGGRGGPGGGGGGPQVQELKWTDEVFAAAQEGQLPLGEHTAEWMFGDVEAQLKQADLVLDETFVGSSTGHQPLEPRTVMAYWQGDKVFVYAGTQSTVQTFARVADAADIPAAEARDRVVFVSEYTGGGFGSKIPGSLNMAIPILLAKKANAPVMHRITREEEHYIGRARPGLTSRVKVGFRKDGKILAIDGFAVADNGPYNQQGDAGSAGSTISLCYQPESMRWRTISVLTNTPPKTSQRAPGGMQGNGLMEPILTKAANQLGIDQVQMRMINAPEGQAPFGPPAAGGRRNTVTSAFVKEALTRGAELFNWEEKKARSGKRVGTKVRGAGVAVSSYTAGSTGFDGLLIIKPDGRVQFQSGIGNLGTHSVIDVHRVAAELLGVPWEQCDVVWGDTSKNLPWTSISAGSQTTHAMTRAAHAVGTLAVQRVKELAARSLGGSPDGYTVADGRVSGRGRSMTFAQVGQKAIELGGIFDGHEIAEDNQMNAFTRRSVQNLAGSGLVVAARDSYPRVGATQSYTVGFAEVEVDVETGAYQIVDFAAVVDVGTVLNPRSLQGQTFGGLMLGIGHAIGQKWVYDEHYGVPLAKRFYHNKPPTIMDAPRSFAFDAVNLPDPQTPVGARGIGEPPVGAGLGAVLNALMAAVGDEVFRKAPVNADIILASLEAGRRMHEPLRTHI